jgi:DNA-binding transcriptional ArsR family regulator
MQLNPVKKAILETLWRKGKPLTPLEVARELGMKNQRQAMMHLLNLRSMEYVSSPGKNCYAITELGKEAMGLPRISKKEASQILHPKPPESAFRFYKEMGRSLGIEANSLQDFCDKVQKIDLRSLEFHMPRKDFENWLQHLGDAELAKKIAVIREQGVSGEELRQKVYEVTKSRCEELKKLTSQ